MSGFFVKEGYELRKFAIAKQADVVDVKSMLKRDVLRKVS